MGLTALTVLSRPCICLLPPHPNTPVFAKCCSDNSSDDTTNKERPNNTCKTPTTIYCQSNTKDKSGSSNGLHDCWCCPCFKLCFASGTHNRAGWNCGVTEWALLGHRQIPIIPTAQCTDPFCQTCHAENACDGEGRKRSTHRAVGISCCCRGAFRACAIIWQNSEQNTTSTCRLQNPATACGT